MRNHSLKNRTNGEIAKQIWKMDLPVDRNGYVPFGVVLHAALKSFIYSCIIRKLIEKTSLQLLHEFFIHPIKSFVAKSNHFLNCILHMHLQL